jgi:acyl-CoA thioesterase I
VSEALQRGKPITIVAVGSSSTAGAGASSPAASYPSRLEALLKQQFPKAQLRVINRGVNGEEAEEMLARFEREVIAEKPALVLWQVGTNAILRDFARSSEAKLIRQGIARLKATGADVVLVDPQYAPAVLAKTDAELMVDLVAVEARDAGAAVFRRFDLMRDWHETERLPFTAFVSGDGLHMNDWGYDCMARNLAAQIAEAAAVPAVASASTSVGR